MSAAVPAPPRPEDVADTHPSGEIHAKKGIADTNSGTSKVTAVSVASEVGEKQQFRSPRVSMQQ